MKLISQLSADEYIRNKNFRTTILYFEIKKVTQPNCVTFKKYLKPLVLMGLRYFWFLQWIKFCLKCITIIDYTKISYIFGR